MCKHDTNTIDRLDTITKLVINKLTCVTPINIHLKFLYLVSNTFHQRDIKIFDGMFFSNKNWSIKLLRKRFFKDNLCPRFLTGSSSIGKSIKDNFKVFSEESLWLPEEDSKISFWDTNWLGYRMRDKISTQMILEASISDF